MKSWLRIGEKKIKYGKKIKFTQVSIHKTDRNWNSQLGRASANVICFIAYVTHIANLRVIYWRQTVGHERNIYFQRNIFRFLIDPFIWHINLISLAGFSTIWYDIFGSGLLFGATTIQGGLKK